MGISVIAYLALLAVVGMGRLAELWISKRNQNALMEQGASQVSERHYTWMVTLHASVLVAAGLEVVFLHRPFLLALSIPMSVLFLLANALRWWVILLLRTHWNVQVMDSTRLGIVTTGPYRWVRHPNYVGVFVELVSLALIHTAWLTSIYAGVGYALVLRTRLEVEDRVLLADPAYRAAMGDKPRFLPKFL